MTREELEAFRTVYQRFARRSIKAEDAEGKEIDEQSDWVWFDRKTIQSLLDMTQEDTGGIKIYFGQYDKDNVDMLPEERRKKHEYVGRVSLALMACNKTKTEYEDIYSGSDEIQDSSKMMLMRGGDGESPANAGDVCPPNCRP